MNAAGAGLHATLATTLRGSSDQRGRLRIDPTSVLAALAQVLSARAETTDEERPGAPRLRQTA